MNFIKNLINEIGVNGKLLSGYVVSQIPQITSFPGIVTSFKTAVADRTPAAYVDVAVQVIMAVAAAIKAKKIVVEAAKKS